MTYLDENGNRKYPVMGCYGIGIGRLAAAVCEAHHDEYGPIWPMPIAPWQVHLCAVRADDHNIRELADNIYNQLVDKSIEVIYDDRSVSAGVMFSDADLLGVPIRVIISPRNLKENCCEIVSRDKKLSLKVNLNECINQIINLVSRKLTE
jgi:prolyl-tRNA synthetase